MSLEHRWNDNDTDRGKIDTFFEKNLSLCHFFHEKSHMDWPGIEFGLPWWEVSLLSHGTAGQVWYLRKFVKQRATWEAGTCLGNHLHYSSLPYVLLVNPFFPPWFQHSVQFDEDIRFFPPYAVLTVSEVQIFFSGMMNALKTLHIIKYFPGRN